MARIGPQRVVQSRASPFEALVRAVVHQSVSGKAAASIFVRLSEVTTRPLTPSKILALRPNILMRAGLSSAKARTIRELARWYKSNLKLAKALPKLSDNELIELLTTIPGIGTWTVNVLLIFNLGRLDVMPAADWGIRRGLQLDGRTSRDRDTQAGHRAVAGLGTISQYRVDLPLAGWEAEARAKRSQARTKKMITSTISTIHARSVSSGFRKNWVLATRLDSTSGILEPPSTTLQMMRVTTMCTGCTTLRAPECLP